MSDRSSEFVMTPSLVNSSSRARIVPDVADFLGVVQKLTAAFWPDRKMRSSLRIPRDGCGSRWVYDRCHDAITVGAGCGFRGCGIPFALAEPSSCVLELTGETSKRNIK